MKKIKAKHPASTCYDRSEDAMRHLRGLRVTDGVFAEMATHLIPSPCYISGPMTGLPDYNYPAFKEAAKKLRAIKVEVLSPEEMDKKHGFHSREEALRRDIEFVCQAKSVCVLPGWQGSFGAVLEVDVARALSLPIFDIDTLKPFEENVAEEALRIVVGSRRKDYGPPSVNHTRTAALWQAYLGVNISKEQVCWMNILQKIARGMNKWKRDSVVDTIGYALNIETMHKEDE
jgi:hypothetical protein